MVMIELPPIVSFALPAKALWRLVLVCILIRGWSYTKYLNRDLNKGHFKWISQKPG